jgi:GT2 family glycosyltransferase
MNRDRVTASIVIPNWNGEEHLGTCLGSIANQTLRPLETILVDNGSTDGSIGLVRASYPWATVVSLPENIGFAHAVNRGIALSTGEYVATLNNDIELAPDWLEVMMGALTSDPGAGSVTCKMMNYFDRALIDAAGDALTPLGAPKTRGHGSRDTGYFRHREYVFGACAGAAVYRKSLFEKVGTFDEDFVSYYEDIDLAFRAQLAGFKTVYVPEAICYHKRNATGNRIAHYPLRMQGRNYVSFILKNLPLSLLAVRIPFMVASRFLWLMNAAKTGALAPALSGMLEGMKLIPGALRKRRMIQKNRVVPVSYIRSFMHR